MTAESIAARIRSMETQLAVLKAQVNRLRTPSSPKTLGELCGILAGETDSTEEEIDAILYRFDWEDEESAEAPE